MVQWQGGMKEITSWDNLLRVEWKDDEWDAETDGTEG